MNKLQTIETQNEIKIQVKKCKYKNCTNTIQVKNNLCDYHIRLIKKLQSCHYCGNSIKDYSNPILDFNDTEKAFCVGCAKVRFLRSIALSLYRGDF